MGSQCSSSRIVDVIWSNFLSEQQSVQQRIGSSEALKDELHWHLAEHCSSSRVCCLQTCERVALQSQPSVTYELHGSASVFRKSRLLLPVCFAPSLAPHQELRYGSWLSARKVYLRYPQSPFTLVSCCLDPRTMICVLVYLSLTRFDAIQLSLSLMHNTKREQVTAASWALQWTYGSESSAYEWKFIPCFSAISPMSAV